MDDLKFNKHMKSSGLESKILLSLLKFKAVIDKKKFSQD
jgi:hypothetical protein